MTAWCTDAHYEPGDAVDVLIELAAADGRARGTPAESSVVEVATDLDPEGAHTAFLRTLGCPPPSAPKDM